MLLLDGRLFVMILNDLLCKQAYSHQFKTFFHLKSDIYPVQINWKNNKSNRRREKLSGFDDVGD